MRIKSSRLSSSWIRSIRSQRASHNRSRDFLYATIFSRFPSFLANNIHPKCSNDALYHWVNPGRVASTRFLRVFMYTQQKKQKNWGPPPAFFTLVAACRPVSALALVLPAPVAAVADEFRKRLEVSLLTAPALAHLLFRCLDPRLLFHLRPSLLLKSFPSLHTLVEPLFLRLDLLLGDNLFHDRGSLANAFEKVCLVRTVLLGIVGVDVAPECSDGETEHPCLVDQGNGVGLGARRRNDLCVGD